MKPIKSVKLLPNIITAANLFCGFLSIIVVSRAMSLATSSENYLLEVTELLNHACNYILLAMVFDALDGKVARMVNGTSDFGAQLDSLCDAVSFCVAPAFLMYGTCRLLPSLSEWYPLGAEVYSTYFKENYLFISAAIYVLCGVMRLARFNVETTEAEEDHRYFKGLPTPAAAAVIVSTVILMFNPMLAEFTSQCGPYFLYILPIMSLATALLMVSSVPYVHVVGLFGRYKASFEVLALVVIVAACSYINFYITMFVAVQLYLLTPVVTIKRKLQNIKEDVLEK